MRLRLSVCRHSLPTADLLWAVPDDKAHDTFTVAQLLEHVNDIIPLENPHWGLEDYAVEIGSYEALHFQKVRDILKDEDQVCIRHLTQPELRARHIAGRDQINANGQHLIDGIPFGKSFFSMRKPYRPLVNIPPLRNPIAETADGDAFPGLLEDTPQLRGHPDDEEHDELFAAEQPARKRRRVESVRSDKSDKSVRFQEDDALTALPSDDDDTEEEYQAPSQDDISSSSTSDSSSDVSSNPASDHDDTKIANAASTDESLMSSSDSDTSTDSDSDSDVSSSEVSASEDNPPDDSDSDSDSSSSDEDDSASSDSTPEEVSSKAPKTLVEASTSNQTKFSNPICPPGNGLDRTKARNRRRRLGKLFKKMTGANGDGITWKDAGKRLDAPQSPRRIDIITAPSHLTETELDRLDALKEKRAVEEKRVALLKRISAMRCDVSNSEENVTTDSGATLTDDKAAEAGGIHADTGSAVLVNAGGEHPHDETQKPAVEAIQNNSAEPTQAVTDRLADAPAAKRKRIDVGSFRRLTMGSLGLRTPKNEEEEQELRERMAADVSARGKKPPRSKSSMQEESEEPEDLQDPEGWKSRVDLKAFEVSDESVQQLSKPPFPFAQRWDPQQHYDRYEEPQQHDYYEEYDKQQYETSNKKKSKKKRKRNNQSYDEQEQYLEADGNDDWAILDYDEPAEVDAAQSQLLQETQDAQSAAGASSKHKSTDKGTNIGDDLPPLPSDVTALQKLVPEDIRTDAVVVYKEMEVSELTGWQPIISDYRRAKVLGTDDDAAYLQLAALDVPRKLSETGLGNDNGVSGSKTFDVTEENGDPTKRWVEFTNMAELWLLQAASGIHEGQIDVNMATNGDESAERKVEIHAIGTMEDSDEGTTEAHSTDIKGEDPGAEK